MQAIRRQANQDVRGYDSTAIQQLPPVNQADNTTSQIVLPRVVQIRKLRRFYADQGAATRITSFNKKQMIQNRRNKTNRYNIVEKMQMERARNRDMIDIMVHEVLSDRCMPAERD